MSKLQGNDKDNRKIAILNKPNHYPNPSAYLNIYRRRFKLAQLYSAKKKQHDCLMVFLIICFVLSCCIFVSLHKLNASITLLSFDLH
jgi:hypothetical protein